MSRLPLHRRAAALGALVALASGSGCSIPSVVPITIPVCASDSECNPGEVCFVDGCGDPGSNLAVEVTPAGQYPQDFEVADLEATQNLELAPQATVTGALLEQDDPPQPFTSRVFMTLTGESLVLPGITRPYQATVTPSATGTYSLPVGTGLYTVNAVPLDSTVPPSVGSEVRVDVGARAPLDLTFAGQQSRVVLAGNVLSSLGTVVKAALEIQALDPATGLPLSQTVPVQSSDGAFSLVLAPAAKALPSFILELRPGQAGQLVPVQRFSASASSLLSALVLSVNLYGDPVSVTGRAVDAAGQPLQNAVVYLDEVVVGGGHLRTPTVRTGSDGSFTFQALATESTGGASLTVLPEPGAPSAALHSVVSISGGTTALGTLTCDNRPVVSGKVKRPDGTALAGGRVVAVPLSNPSGSPAGQPLPADGAQTLTDSEGQFFLPLEPASYRIDVLPGEKFPRTSRYVTVDPDVSSSGQQVPKTLPDIVLSKGRTLVGAVSLFPTADASQQPAPRAAVRFFRIVQVNGHPASMPLAESLADSAAQYTVTLPVH